MVETRLPTFPLPIFDFLLKEKKKRFIKKEKKTKQTNQKCHI